MEFTTIEHDGVKGLACEWIIECQSGCCHSDGVEIRAIINNQCYSMFIDAATREDSLKILRGEGEKFKDVLRNIFVDWVALIKMEELSESMTSPFLPTPTSSH